MRTVTVWFDGACKPENPGGTGVYGFRATAGDGEEVVDAGVFGRDPGITSNVAEYVALEKALTAAVERFDPDHVHAIGDSELVIKQVKGEFDVNSGRLRPFHADVERLVDRMDASLQLQHVGREENEVAHGLCERAYEDYLYSDERETARETPMPVAAVGDGVYEVDGERVHTGGPAEPASCSCEDYTDHGAKCVHIHKAELLEAGTF